MIRSVWQKGSIELCRSWFEIRTKAAQWNALIRQSAKFIDVERGVPHVFCNYKYEKNASKISADRVLVSTETNFVFYLVCKVPFDRPDVTGPGTAIPAFLRFMIRWTECLHGNGSLREALMLFCDLSLAEVVHLHRVNMVTGGQRSIATFDRQASQGARPLIRAHGLALVGQTLSRAKPGTLWSMQELDFDAASDLEPRVLAWMKERGLRDAMLIPLSTAADTTDVLEFYLSVPLDLPRRRGLETLTAAAAEAWGRRPEGRIARILRAAPAINEHLSMGRPTVHPLSASNPLGLTAAELRICVMMQRGTDLTDASVALGIAGSTLRSHLRSIFAKAGVAGQVGLVRVLLDPEAARSSMRA